MSNDIWKIIRSHPPPQAGLPAWGPRSVRGYETAPIIRMACLPTNQSAVWPCQLPGVVWCLQSRWEPVALTLPYSEVAGSAQSEASKSEVFAMLEARPDYFSRAQSPKCPCPAT